MSITQDRVVSIHYTLKDDAGDNKGDEKREPASDVKGRKPARKGFRYWLLNEHVIDDDFERPWLQG